MNKTKASMCILITSLVMLAPFFGTVYGITGNYKPASNSYVGVVVLFSDTSRQNPIGFATGFLLSPTVMVTSGHSLIGVAALSVCFDNGPISYTIDDGKIVYNGASKIYNGIPVKYPGYVPSASANIMLSTSDIGLIKLERRVSTVVHFPSLPPSGFADTLSAQTTLQVLGYGFQTQTTPRNSGVMESWTGSLSRNYADVSIVSTSFEGSDKYLKLSANPSQDKGGIAFGDSGGPVIYSANGAADVVLAVNAFVNSDNCNGVTFHTRIDNPQILAWIDGYI